MRLILHLGFCLAQLRSLYACLFGFERCGCRVGRGSTSIGRIQAVSISHFKNFYRRKDFELLKLLILGPNLRSFHRRISVEER